MKRKKAMTEREHPAIIKEESILAGRQERVPEASQKKLFAMEIQRADTLDHARRVRYYVSMVDSEYLKKGKDYREMPEVYMIYISKTDLWKTGKSFCTVEQKLLN